MMSKQPKSTKFLRKTNIIKQGANIGLAKSSFSFFPYECLGVVTVIQNNFDRLYYDSCHTNVNFKKLIKIG